MSNEEKNKKTIEIAHKLISKEEWESDPIYQKVDEWVEQGVDFETIRSRVKRYMEKKALNNIE